MALYTPLGDDDAARLAQAHGLGALRGVTGVVAGSVNSNYLLETEAGTVFARIYEEQEQDGVAYEWALLDHLRAAAIPVPRRVPGPGPGELRVAGKPTAVFELAEGAPICQAMVDRPRAAAIGRLLAESHLAGASFGTRRAGRFGRAEVRARLEAVIALDRPELRAATARLSATLDEVDAAWDDSLPSGVIHGDLFRDNVLWDGDRVGTALDWESASDGLFVFDLAVALLAWCYGDAMGWDLAAALVAGYEAARPLEPRERPALRTALRAAACRFTVTRVTDFHLREGGGQEKKDWRRFLARLAAVEEADLASRLAG